MKKLTALFLVLLLVVPCMALAAEKFNEVGGVKLIHAFTGDSAATAAAVSITGLGFTPDVIFFVDDHDATAPDILIHISDGGSTDMANNSAIRINGADGVISYESTAGATCGFDLSTSGTVVIAAACQVNSGDYMGFMLRDNQ